MPGLCANFDGADFADAPPLPHLSLLLARGRCIAGPAQTLEAQACALLNVRPDAHGELPFAALSWLADTGVRPDGPLLRADPVYLRADQTQVRLFHAEQLGIERADADALIATLNAHFTQDGLAFGAPLPYRWYARLPAAARMQTTPLSAINGQPIGEALPTGADARLWRQRLNEVQMLLHEHPVNVARRARRQPPVNGVWFWGGAELPGTIAADYTEIAGDNAVVAGLAKLAGVPLRGDLEGAARGHRLWSFEALAPWAAFGDWRTWLERLARLDAVLFAALTRRLRADGGCATLFTGSERDFRVCSLDLKRFWRRVRPPFGRLTCARH